MKLTRDKRPALEQVKSGLRIAFALVASITTIALFAKGYELLNHPPSNGQIVIGCLLLGSIAVLLLCTTQYWRLWFPGIPAYLGLRSSFGLFFGWFMPGISSLWAFAFPLLMFAMVFLSLRFSRKRSRISTGDRAVLFVALVCLLVALSNLILFGLSMLAIVFSAAGNGVLLLSWLYWSWIHARRKV